MDVRDAGSWGCHEKPPGKVATFTTKRLPYGNGENRENWEMSPLALGASPWRLAASASSPRSPRASVRRGGEETSGTAAPVPRVLPLLTYQGSP